MSLKKTDMVKNLAKKLDGKMKAKGIPQRFAQGSADATSSRPAKRDPHATPAAPKLVAVACRLPADLLNRVREQAVGQEGGINAVMAEALSQWLDARKGA